jgi:hypothetical protein
MNDNTTAKRDFGALLKQLRNNKNLSLRKLGQATYLPHSFIAGIEAGDRPAGPSVAIKLADGLALCGEVRNEFLLLAAHTPKRDHLLQESRRLDTLTINFLPLMLMKHGVVADNIKSTELVNVNDSGAYAAREQLNIELKDGRKVSCEVRITNN